MKIGILGGTFNPIHYGHIRPALSVKQQLNLDGIWLMPNALPPHKNIGTIGVQHRLAMVKLACQQIPEFAVCDIEINPQSALNQHNHSLPSYTVNTLSLLKQQYPSHQFTFIMGTDSLINLDKWYQWQQLFDLCNIAVCSRPNFSANISSLSTDISSRISQSISTKILKQDNGVIHLLNVPPQAFSSTDLRITINALFKQPKIITAAQRNFIQTALPKEVLNYIEQNKLYQ